MTAHRHVWLLAGLLAGCAGKPEPLDQLCARRAYTDPAVKQMIMLQAGSPDLSNAGQQALREAERQAALRCLRDHGLFPPGGVQPRRTDVF